MRLTYTSLNKGEVLQKWLQHSHMAKNTPFHRDNPSMGTVHMVPDAAHIYM